MVMDVQRTKIIVADLICVEIKANTKKKNVSIYLKQIHNQRVSKYTLK